MAYSNIIIEYLQSNRNPKSKLRTNMSKANYTNYSWDFEETKGRKIEPCLDAKCQHPDFKAIR